MKKWTVILLAILVLCTGCSGKSDEGKEHSFEVSELSGEIKDGIAFEDELNECSRDAVFFKKYAVEEEDVVKQSTYFSTNATTEEISVVECKDEEAAKRVQTAFEQRISEQKSVFESYAPDEIARLDKAIVKTLGKYAVLCVTADPDKAEKIIEKY